MTIVLQHQFWDLTVSDDAFEVGLSFGGVPERLLVPFDAIKGFFDPSVQFGLQFEIAERDSRRDRGRAKPPATRRAARRRRKPARAKPTAGARPPRARRSPTARRARQLADEAGDATSPSAAAKSCGSTASARK